MANPLPRADSAADGEESLSHASNQVARQPPDQPQNDQQPKPDSLSQWIPFMIRFFLMYLAVQFIQAGVGSDASIPPLVDSTTGQVYRQPASNSVIECAWPLGTVLDLRVFLDEREQFRPGAHDEPILFESGLVLGNWSQQVFHELQIPASKSVQRNGTLYAHVFLSASEWALFPPKLPTDWSNIVYRRKLLTPYLRKKSAAAFKNLISSLHRPDTGSDEADPTAPAPAVEPENGWIVSHWDRNLTLDLVSDLVPISAVEIRSLPFVMRHVQWVEWRDRFSYLPIVYVNEFWTLNENLLDFPINESVHDMPLTIRLAPMANWKFRLIAHMDHSFRVQYKAAGMSETELDSLRRALFETNPILLGVTAVVSLLHALFDFLAFKNDIQFWKDRDNFDGLSVRTILVNIVFQLVIVLYLFDNETSWLVLISSVIGLIIDVWKLRKVMRISVDWQSRSCYGLLPFRLHVENTMPQTRLSRETDDYDAIAFKYLGVACFPLAIGYSIYSLLYESHKSWYSYCIGTLVGFVYTFGFITMTPQLFINYKLKSVAHMPWKTFMYKALNTFVDDLFAFIIKMPTLHRLACFRDDIIFLIYLYQRWVYPVDSKRPNEYGQVGQVKAEDVDADKKDK